jgi:hypothetical protein
MESFLCPAGEWREGERSQSIILRSFSRGFVDPLMLDSEKLIEEAIGRNNAVGGGMVRREEPKVGGSRKSTGSGLRRQKKN